MKEFRFRLEPILTLRRSQEEQLQLQLAERERELNEAQAQLDQTSREILQQEASMQAWGRPGQLDLDKMTNAAGYTASLRRVAETQQELIDLKNRAVAECRNALPAATTYRKGLERLKEHKLADFESEIERRELSGIEEMAVQRYHYSAVAETDGR